ncbi:MAG: TolC family protein, partial [Hydrogenovibrio sp.]|uniref:TolC family protein n=1 Tax=Hydrogenovibrio sp. TaxID=2065821 RepID=UPI00286FF4CB
HRENLAAESENVDQAWSQVLPNVSAYLRRGKAEYTTGFVEDEPADFTRSGISLVQPLFSMKRFEGIGAAKAGYQRFAKDFDLKRFQTGLETLHAYIDAAKASELLALSRAEIEDHKVRMRRVDAMLERGLATEVDQLETQSKYDELRAQEIADTNTRKVMLKRLEQYVGQRGLEIASIQGDLWQLSEGILAQDNWVSRIENAALSVQVAQSALEESRQKKDLSQAEYWPEVNARVEYRKTDSYETGMENESRAVLEMSLPLYEGGRTNSAVRQAQNQIDRDAFFLADEKHKASVQAEESLSKIRGSYENIQAYRRSVESANAYLAAAEKGLSYGLRSVYEVLEAKTRLYTTQKKLVTEKHENLKAQLELLFLTGHFAPQDVAQLLQARQLPEALRQPA